MKKTAIRSIRIIHVVILAFLLPNLIFALPDYQTTQLPFKKGEKFEKGDAEMVSFILGQTFFQDLDDEEHYYYMPRFRVNSRGNSGANLLLQKHQIRLYEEILHLSEKRFQISWDRYYSLQNSLDKLENSLEEEQLSSHDSMKGKYLKEVIAIKKERLEDLFSHSYARSDSLPFIPKKVLNGRLWDLLSFGNFLLGASLPDNYVEIHEFFDYPRKFSKIKQEIASSYGGSLSINLSAGLTRKELGYLQDYKRRFAPDIKISPLPIEKFIFKSLTELEINSDGEKNMHSGHRIFRSFTGGGSFSGATINFDLSLAGALSFDKRLGPFILPVAIEGEYKMQARPFHAKLHCDFSSGIKSSAAIDLKDGLVIYNDDLKREITSEDKNEGGCYGELISGDRDSSYWGIMQTLEHELESLQFERVRLGHRERLDYVKNLSKMIESRRAGRANNEDSRPDKGGFLGAISDLWRGSSLRQVVHGVGDFYWHTTRDQLDLLSHVKFSKEIKMKGFKKVRREIPVQLCLIWDEGVKGYTGCNLSEERKAKTLGDAVREKTPSMSLPELLYLDI